MKRHRHLLFFFFSFSGELALSLFNGFQRNVGRWKIDWVDDIFSEIVIDAVGKMGMIVCHSWKLTLYMYVLFLCYSSLEINESYSFLRVVCKLYVILNIPDIRINKVKISVLSNLKLVYTTKTLSKLYIACLWDTFFSAPCSYVFFLFVFYSLAAWNIVITVLQFPPDTCWI